MENDLVSIYENNYLQGSIVEEKRAGKADINKNGKIEGWESARDKAIKNSMGHEEDDEDEDTHEEAVKRKIKKKSMKTKNKKPVDAGEIYGDSFQRSENIFDKILREMDEMGGNYDSSMGESDDVFGASDTSDTSNEEEQTFTLSELRSMTLSELAALLEGEEETEDEEDEYSFEDGSDEDEIPSESYGFTGGEGNYKGDQGTYDGKAKKQPSTSHVKGNGDADFGKADTGYDPEDTEGSEGSHLGDQGNYDGKAKKQPSTDFVKGNGDTNFSKAKTNVKTSSGKKDKNYF